jgi:hypothetical protein
MNAGFETPCKDPPPFDHGRQIDSKKEEKFIDDIQVKLD